MSRFINIKGHRFLRLVAIKHSSEHQKWLCHCDCGRETFASGWQLRNGYVQSCGCLNSELSAARKRTHGMAGSPEYLAWQRAKKRCIDPVDKAWHNYGGRGIQMCDEWANDFSAFFAHVGRRPTARHELDRMDVNGHYEPGNVRWVTKVQQANNLRRTIRITWNGRTESLQDWGRELGIPAERLYHRIVVMGWDANRAITAPLTPVGTPGPKPSLRRTHCKRGHARTPDNVTSNGTCRKCGHEKSAARRARLRATSGAHLS